MSLGHYVISEREVLKDSRVCVKKIMEVIVYNVCDKKKLIHESVARAKTEVAGGREGECQLINVERMIELESPHFAIPKEIIGLDKDH